MYKSPALLGLFCSFYYLLSTSWKTNFEACLQLLIIESWKLFLALKWNKNKRSVARCENLSLGGCKDTSVTDYNAYKLFLSFSKRLVEPTEFLLNEDSVNCLHFPNKYAYSLYEEALEFILKSLFGSC